jgi:hypothetical protein
MVRDLEALCLKLSLSSSEALFCGGYPCRVVITV